MDSFSQQSSAKVCGEVIKRKTLSGQHMVLIRDDRNMEFALVPWRPEYGRLRKSKWSIPLKYVERAQS